MKSAAIAGATAAAFYGVGGLTNAVAGVDPSLAHIQPAFGTPAYAVNVAGHALVGCGASVASGGSCQSGALSGGVSAAAGPITNGQNFARSLIADAVVGGLASVAGGGKFANGAVIGAFGYVFNAAAGRLIGGRIGLGIGLSLGIESGPGAVAAGLIGRAIFGEIGSAIEDWLISRSVSEDGGRYSGRYADGDKAYRTNVPRDGNNNPVPDPDADGPHSRLQMDTRNPSRIYSATEFNQEQAVKRIDFGRPVWR